MPTPGSKDSRHHRPWFSQAAEVADLAFSVTVDGLGPFDSVVPATAIVESLVAGILGKLGERADRRIRESHELTKGTMVDCTCPFSGRDCPCSREASRG
jgi:hypothetical protein